MGTDESPNTGEAEATSLRARVAELEELTRRLREELESAQRIIERAPLVLYVLDLRERRNLYANCELTSLLGYGAEDVQRLRTNFLPTLMHPDDLERTIPEHFARLAKARDGEMFEVTYRMRNPKGEWRWLKSRDTIYARDERGEPTQIIGAVNDVTDRVEAEREHELLAQEKQRKTDELVLFQTLVSKALDGIAISTMDGRFIYSNPAYREITGFGDRVTGAVVPDVVAPEAASFFLETIQPAILREGRWQGLIPHRRPDGTRWMGYVSVFLVADPAGGEPQIAGVVRDVTVQLQAEEERTALQAKIIKAQREALRELGTPLIPIAQGVIAMPVIGAIDDDRAKQLIEALLTGVAAQRAKIAILDITGVKSADAGVADALVRASRAARLLGAEVVLTGIGPEVAQALVGLGAELPGVVVRGTFEGGIAYAWSLWGDRA